MSTEYFFNSKKTEQNYTLTIKPPKTNKFTINSTPVSVCKSEGRIIDENRKECVLYIPIPEKSSFGTSLVHDPKIPEKERTLENASGMQMYIPLSSLQTAENPTEEEQSVITLFDNIWQTTVDSVCQLFENAKEENDDGDVTFNESKLGVPKATVTSYRSECFKKKPQWRNVVKFPYIRPKKKDDKGKSTSEPDNSKPFGINSKLLITRPKGSNTMIVVTPFSDEHGETINPMSLLKMSGTYSYVLRWDGAYYGMHGNDNPQGVSCKFSIVEVQYKPSSGNKLPTRRFFSSTPKKEIKPSDDGDHDFTTGDPTVVLEEAIKKKKSPKKKSPQIETGDEDEKLKQKTPKKKISQVETEDEKPKQKTPKKKISQVETEDEKPKQKIVKKKKIVKK